MVFDSKVDLSFLAFELFPGNGPSLALSIKYQTHKRRESRPVFGPWWGSVTPGCYMQRVVAPEQNINNAKVRVMRAYGAASGPGRQNPSQLDNTVLVSVAQRGRHNGFCYMACAVLFDSVVLRDATSASAESIR
jgi:hypothetical protein